MAEAIALLHQPPAGVNTQTILEGRHPAQLRLASEELIAHQISMLSRRARTLQLLSAKAVAGGRIAQAIIEALPFSLTSAQTRVCSEIVEDLKKPTPMLRLLQGDVGSGKTLVAAISAAHMVEAEPKVHDRWNWFAGHRSDGCDDCDVGQRGYRRCEWKCKQFA